MDGFNVIPVENTTSIASKPSTPKENNSSFSAIDPNIEIIDENKEKEKQIQAEKGGGMLLSISVILLIGVFLYLTFLIFQRVSGLSMISGYSDQLKSLSQKIDLNEMKSFQAMDISLKAINGKLGKHVLNTAILSIVNQNLRNSIQVSEYRLDVKPETVEVNLTGTAPTFKDLAEQTEKMFQLKASHVIDDFAVTNLSFETASSRVRFTLRINFDKQKYTALAASNYLSQQQRQQINNNSIPIPPETDNGATQASTTNIKQ